ncbi:MAG: hypothetical protein CMO82_00955 [Winogradskyella sp.]|jgi:hypothetical protein|uniref:DUF3945 domain-containing protein n=2 Tax=Flavobacteriaceae TaxID=49546 RepID=A0A9X1ZV01_9FLAO|nr:MULTISPECIES: DUF3945 domain-containing protein [Bacteroidota]MBL85214.1 hypothetical protein [Winogradskyella sp.]RPG27994.1 MAG: DUF3945 domain-containing protein [Muricauda sp. TMED12]GMN08099.1 DUF3945 domain-containing protein [Croceitalea sp. MTPC5]GMN10617.1 DUF3945 domain-containing protein [Croceitalea sp. MTPC6]GMN17470.1 DUF3945 domain-containing protein [Croceitalea sp. MTPC9]HNP69132.1 DUF3945 domain-containing protein [Aequorivita sp.]|tara:strand:- start:15218 stop:16693 length:1476 start_codon:yes stop_codon:yes gene_type:complete
MSEETTNKQDMPEQLSDILLVLDKEKMKIQAVKSIDENGKMETVEPTKKNQNQFMRVDKSGDFFSNFFSNFFSQLKNPTNFSFFKVPAPLAIDKAQELQKQVDKPTPEGEKVMKEYEVKTEPQQDKKQENQNNMATAQTTPEVSEYRYKPEQIDWDTMKNLGLSKEYLEKRNLLDPLLRGYKTNELLPIGVNFGGSVLRTDARLSLQQAEDGNVIVAIHGIKKEPNLHFEFFGHKFTDEDKKNLLETGNMGRVVNLVNSKTGELMPSIISIDRLTNDVIALRTEFIKIPDEIKGVKLNEEQKQTLMEGKPLKLEGMISTKGTEFSATVQFNADKRYVEFLFDRNNSNRQTQSNGQAQSKGQNNQQSQPQEAPKTFRGKELTDEQHKDFKAGQTIYIDGLKDKKGQPYQGYITFNKDTGKTGFEFPNQYKERVKPTEAHKTQTAVNSEGKTNEATKNVQEPLKSGQQSPKNKQQQEQQEKPETPAKSKGRKM